MTAKMVRLPAELGGAEVESVGGVGVPLTVWGKPADVVKVPGVGWIAVPISALSEVEPPLPPEPGPGAYLIGEHLVARAGWDTGRDPWRYLGPGLPGDERGASTLAGDSTWPEVWALVGGPDLMPRRLVPAPEPNDDKPSPDDWAAGRKAARIHGYAGGTEVNSVSFAAGFAVGFRKGQHVSAPEPVTLPWRNDPLGVRVGPAGLSGSPHTVVVETSNVSRHILPWLAREAAYALLTAADQAEGGTKS